MKLFMIICVLLVPNALSASIKTLGEVLILTDDNYESAINSNEYLLLDFYAPWCGPCRKLSPEYSKAAEILHEKQPDIKLAKVNVDEEEHVAEEYDVRSLPTLKFFRKGSVIEYTGGRKADQIVNWLIKKMGTPMQQLSSKEEVQSFIDANKVAIIGFFKNQESDGAKTFLSVGNDLFDMHFANISDDALFSAYDAKEGAIILFKQFDEPKVVYNGELTEESIKDFIKKNSEPLLKEFHVDEEGINTIFKNTIKDFLFLMSSEESNFKQHEKEIADVAKEFKDRVLFLTVDIDDEEMEPFLNEVRGPVGLPKVILAHLVNARAYKLDYYKYEGEGFDANNIKKFVQDYLDGKLQPYKPKKEDSVELTDEPESITTESIHEEPESVTTERIHEEPESVTAENIHDEPESVTAESINEEPESVMAESIIEETKEDTSDEVKEESVESSQSSEAVSSGSKEKESEESQEDKSTHESKQEKKAKRSHKRAIHDSDMFKKMYKTIQFSL